MMPLTLAVRPTRGQFENALRGRFMNRRKLDYTELPARPTTGTSRNCSIGSARYRTDISSMRVCKQPPSMDRGHRVTSSPQPSDAVEFHSEIASDFHASYRSDANRRERVRIWNAWLDRYAKDATVAYDVGCGSGVLASEIARRRIGTVR